MAVNDFARRMLGFDPLAMFGAGGDQPVAGPQANAATVAQPTLDQLYDQDLSRARMDRVGNLGMMLMAASGQLTPAQRATILAQAPAYMDGAERDAMTAAQARLYGMRGRAEQDEMARAETMRQRFADPEFLRAIGLKPEVGEALGQAGIQKLIENQALANTPEAQLDRQLKQAQIDHLMHPTRTADPYEDTMSRERAQFDARMEQGHKLGLQGEDLTQFASTGKIQTANEKQTQDQANAALFSRRMDEANQIISNPEIQKYSMGARGTMNRANAAIPVIGNAFLDPQFQQFDQAKRDFINAVMRRESGAKIDTTEFENADKQYFPQVGDSEVVLRQKAANRATAIKGIYDAASPQYRRNTPLGTPASGEQPAADMQLPSGVTSIRRVR